jgi:hypothetical protein
MVTDLLGNELFEDDICVMKITEQSVGRLVKITEGSSLAKVAGGVMIGNEPTMLTFLVEVHRLLKPGTNIVDVIKAYQKRNQPANNNQPPRTN